MVYKKCPKNLSTETFLNLVEISVLVFLKIFLIFALKNPDWDKKITFSPQPMMASSFTNFYNFFSSLLDTACVSGIRISTRNYATLSDALNVIPEKFWLDKCCNTYSLLQPAASTVAAIHWAHSLWLSKRSRRGRRLQKQHLEVSVGLDTISPSRANITLQSSTSSVSKVLMHSEHTAWFCAVSRKKNS